MDRKLLQEEEINVLEKLKREFKFSEKYWLNEEYWIPLDNPANKVKIDKAVLYLPSEKVLCYAKEIEDLVKRNDFYYYLTGAGGYFYFDHLVEETDFFSMECQEYVYFGKSFDWLIYVSHESTITFCGDNFVFQIKKILAKEEAFFNTSGWSLPK